MFAARYFTNRAFAPRYFPNVGAVIVIVPILPIALTAAAHGRSLAGTAHARSLDGQHDRALTGRER